uniref:Uncharacterized protein n=1 Tax=Coturnix japonica TaxID=93934 RepID=A0A8C2T178_COTJA
MAARAPSYSGVRYADSLQLPVAVLPSAPSQIKLRNIHLHH